MSQSGLSKNDWLDTQPSKGRTSVNVKETLVSKLHLEVNGSLPRSIFYFFINVIMLSGFENNPPKVYNANK